jgi:glucosamine-6-phosphate deaminase
MAQADDAWRLTVVADEAAMSREAADVVTDTLLGKPDAVISLPTGTTPLGMYDILAARAARGEVDFSRLHFFCLDEYLDVSGDDPNSLTGWLQAAFISRAGIAPERAHTLPVTAEDLDGAAGEYERDLAALGGLDLVVLGLGPNGHIAYNEPGSSAASRTRVITLTPESRTQAAAYWAGAVPVPEVAMTMGVGTLLEAKRIALIAAGPAKAEILRRALEEAMSPNVPASWLRLAGSRFEAIVDEAAASLLTRARDH